MRLFLTQPSHHWQIFGYFLFAKNEFIYLKEQIPLEFIFQELCGKLNSIDFVDTFHRFTYVNSGKSKNRIPIWWIDGKKIFHEYCGKLGYIIEFHLWICTFHLFNYNFPQMENSDFQIPMECFYRKPGHPDFTEIFDGKQELCGKWNST